MAEDYFAQFESVEPDYFGQFEAAPEENAVPTSSMEHLKQFQDWFTNTPNIIGLQRNVEKLPFQLWKSIVGSASELADKIPALQTKSKFGERLYETLTKREQENERRYQESMKEHPFYTEAGALAGELPYALPQFAAGTTAAGKLLPEAVPVVQSYLGNILGSTLHGEMEPAENIPQRLEHAGEEGKLAAQWGPAAELAGAGIGKTIESALHPKDTIANLASKLFKSNLSPEELLARQAATAGTETSLGRVIESPMLSKMYENVTTQIPGSSGDDIFTRTAQQLEGKGQQAIQSLIKNAPDMDPNDLASKILQDAFKQQRTYKNELYNQVSETAGKEGFKLELPNFAKMAKNTRAVIEDSVFLNKDADFKSLYNKLAGFEKPVKETAGMLVNQSGAALVTKTTYPTIAETNMVANTLDTLASQLVKSSDAKDRSIASTFEKLAKAARDDLKASIKNNGSSKLQSEFNEASKNYAENFSKFLDDDVYKLLRAGDEAETFARDIIRPGKAADRADRLEKVMNLLPEEERGLVGYAYLSGAIDKEGKLNVGNLLSRINSLGPRQFEVLFQNKEVKKNILNFEKLAKLNPDAINVMFNPKTGQRNTTWLSGLLSGGAGVTGGLPGLVATAGLQAGAANLFNKMMTSEAFRDKVIKNMTQKEVRSLGQALSDQLRGEIPTSTILTVLGLTQGVD